MHLLYILAPPFSGRLCISQALAQKMFIWAGCSTLTIQETQQREWAADGTLTVKSDPILDIVGGSKFTTSAEFIVQNSAAQPGCEVSLSWRLSLQYGHEVLEWCQYAKYE